MVFRRFRNLVSLLYMVCRAQWTSFGRGPARRMGFGDHGMCFSKEDVTLVGPASQAGAKGVKARSGEQRPAGGVSCIEGATFTA